MNERVCICVRMCSQSVRVMYTREHTHSLSLSLSLPLSLSLACQKVPDNGTTCRSTILPFHRAPTVKFHFLFFICLYERYRYIPVCEFQSPKHAYSSLRPPRSQGLILTSSKRANTQGLTTRSEAWLNSTHPGISGGYLKLQIPFL